MSQLGAVAPGGAVNPSVKRPFFRRLISNGICALTGWRVEVNDPVPSKCVVIGAPHTTGADLFLAWYLKAATGLDFSWAAKDELFIWPIAWFLRGIGGVPVNRRERTDFVGQMVKHFETRDVFILGIAPEGTRGKGNYWKTGFYYIAVRANVPIIFGYADYKRKIVGFGPMIMPTGDINADFEHIKKFYTPIPGRFPDRQGAVQLKPVDGSDTQA